MKIITLLSKLYRDAANVTINLDEMSKDIAIAQRLIDTGKAPNTSLYPHMLKGFDSNVRRWVESVRAFHIGV